MKTSETDPFTKYAYLVIKVGSLISLTAFVVQKVLRDLGLAGF
ncbi:MAG TPA: hypothetical protein VGE29_02415 [Prosthecobacter sp.]